MNTLYSLRLTSGKPHQRVYRCTHRVLASGASSADAGRRATAYLRGTGALPVDHNVRLESATLICPTPDLVIHEGT